METKQCKVKIFATKNFANIEIWCKIPTCHKRHFRIPRKLSYPYQLVSMLHFYLSRMITICTTNENVPLVLKYEL